MGSNIQARRHIRHGLQLLAADFVPVRQSPVYRSRAVGFEGDDFLNLVVSLDTGAEPGALVEKLHGIEKQAGRRRKAGSWRSRVLDLDLLLYGSEVIDRPGLKLPRPEIVDYAFVLKPLADLAGEMLHPTLQRSFNTLWTEFSDPEQTLTRVDMS
jgi:2-amino-4-hydroxy-6-hydroxymethyldihydropteridine diphosphokinase